MENPPEAYEEAEAETEPESEDRAREDVPTRNALPDGRMECEFCGRKFNPASYERHQPICQKVFGGTRPQFLKSYGAGKGGDRVRVDRGAPGGQSLQNGQSPRSLAKASSTQKSGQRPESGQSPRGQGAAASKNPATLQRTDGPFEPPQRESDQLLANRQDSCDLEQRVMQVMHEHMEELRSLRRQVREEPVESHSKVGSSSPRTKVNSADKEGESGTLTGASGAPRPQERARRSPKRANPEERLLPQPKKGAGEDRIPAKSPSSLVSAAEMQLIPCEDCGRRFNPASLEKHRAVCRSVFGKTRSTFESQNQRLRGVKETASENEASTPAPRRRHQAVLEAKVETQPVAHAFAFAPTLSAPRAVEVGERSSKGAVSPRRASRELDLQPCPHCKRSFRPAVVDKHVKVCKSVFHAHDPKRNPNNGREQRNTKTFEAAAPGDAKVKAKPTPRNQLEVEQVKVDVSESVPMTFGDQGCEPASPIWSLAFEVPEVQAVGRAKDGLDIWEQEVEEAIQAMSEPTQDISLMNTPSSGIPRQFLQDAVGASPLKGSCRSLEERSTLLERARLGMKMGRPQPLFSSNSFSSADRCGSEIILPSDRYQADPPQPAPFGFGFFQATASTSYEVAYRRGAPDYLSRSQPVVPIVGEAPLSSRSERTIEVGKVSPQRRLSLQSGANSSGVLGLAKDGLSLPVHRRELEEPARPSEVSRAIGFGSQAPKVKPGVAREDPAPARISMSQSFTLSASSTSPLQPRSGSMQLPVRSQRTPREHWQAAVPAAPPPSPSIPSRQRMAKVAPTVSVPSVASPRVSPALRPGVASSRAPLHPGACTASPLLRVRSVEPPHRVPRMVSPQHRMVPRLDLAKLKRR